MKCYVAHALIWLFISHKDLTLFCMTFEIGKETHPWWSCGGTVTHCISFFLLWDIPVLIGDILIFTYPFSTVPKNRGIASTSFLHTSSTMCYLIMVFFQISNLFQDLEMKLY